MGNRLRDAETGRLNQVSREIEEIMPGSNIALLR